MTLPPPFCSCMLSPSPQLPSPRWVAGAQRDDWEIPPFLPSLPDQPGSQWQRIMGTSRSEAAITRSLGFGSGIRALGHAHTSSRGRSANLGSDRKEPVSLIVKISGPSARAPHGPCVCVRISPCWLFTSRACVIIPLSWGSTVIDQSWAPSHLYCLGCSHRGENRSVDCTAAH